MSECVRVRVGVSSVFLSSVLLDIFLSVICCAFMGWMVIWIVGKKTTKNTNKKKFMRTQLNPKSKHSLEDNEKRKNTWFFFWNLLLRISWKDDSCFYCGWFVCHHFRIQNWIPSIVLLYKKTTPTHWCSHHRLFLFVWLKIRNCVFFF